MSLRSPPCQAWSRARSESRAPPASPAATSDPEDYVELVIPDSTSGALVLVVLSLLRLACEVECTSDPEGCRVYEVRWRDGEEVDDAE